MGLKEKYDFFRLRYELDRNQFLLGVIMNYLSGIIRFSFEYLFVSHSSLEPVFIARLYKVMNAC